MFIFFLFLNHGGHAYFWFIYFQAFIIILYFRGKVLIMFETRFVDMRSIVLWHREIYDASLLKKSMKNQTNTPDDECLYERVCVSHL